MFFIEMNLFLKFLPQIRMVLVKTQEGKRTTNLIVDNWDNLIQFKAPIVRINWRRWIIRQEILTEHLKAKLLNQVLTDVLVNFDKYE